MSTPTAYPLQWPSGWPTTVIREPSRFNTSLFAGLNQLKREVHLLGGKNLVLSSNYTLDSKPTNPGVVAYFTLDGANIAVPCDRWNRIECNVTAITKTINAMRGMERWGAKHMIKAMFTGFKALPASGRHWSEVLGVPENAARDQVEGAYRTAAKMRHPDAGGSNQAMAEVNGAWAEAKLARGWQ